MNDFDVAFQNSMVTELYKFAATAKAKPAEPTNETIKGGNPQKDAIKAVKGIAKDVKKAGNKLAPSGKGPFDDNPSDGLLDGPSDKESSGASALYAQYRHAMNQRYGY